MSEKWIIIQIIILDKRFYISDLKLLTGTVCRSGLILLQIARLSTLRYR